MKKLSLETKEHELTPRLANELAVSSAIPVMDDLYTTVKHFPNLGDQIAVMPACKKYYDVTGRKIKFCQVINQAASYYPGAQHGTVDENGTMVTMNEVLFEMMKPLMESQEYIHSYVKYEGQKIDLDFDVIRGKTFVNLPHGAIQAWIVYAFPDLSFDLSKEWIALKGKCPIHIKKQVSGKIIINFTERYRNGMTDYFFLKNYMPDLIFAGTEREYWLFCNKWQLTIPRLEVKDFLEYAYAINECRFMLCNQSFGWNIAEAIKKPRILEVCQYAQNCQIMIGEDSYGFFHQTGVEYYVKVLDRKFK